MIEDISTVVGRKGQASVIRNINAQSVGQERSNVGCADEGISYFGSGRCLYILLGLTAMVRERYIGT